MPESLVSSQEKWDRRFSEKNQLPPTARVIMDNRDLLPKQGRGLEVACGLGANSLFLAEQGLHIEAWDISTVALAKLTQRAQQLDLSLCTRWIDVEIEQDFPRQHYDLIVVSHFLYRPLCALLSEALRPGGLLFYQTFCSKENQAPKATTELRPDGNTAHTPCNPLYKLRPKELVTLFTDLEVVRYQEGHPDSDTHKAYYVGRKTNFR